MKRIGNKKGKTIKRILHYAAPYRTQLILAMIFAVFYVLLNLTAPILVGYAIDDAVGKGNVDFAAIGNIVLIISVCFIIILSCRK